MIYLTHRIETSDKVDQTVQTEGLDTTPSGYRVSRKEEEMEDSERTYDSGPGFQYHLPGFDAFAYGIAERDCTSTEETPGR
jgi:hypothetical protein